MTALTVQKSDTELVQKLKEILQNGETQKSLATKLGYSQAALNTYLKNEYAGDIDAFETAIKKFLHLHSLALSHKKITLTFENTSVANRILNIAQICQLNSEIGICTGNSGFGKTTAIKHYANIQSGVILVDPDENASPRALLKQIATQLKLNEFNQCIEIFIADIIKKINNSGYLIIVDEAENLNSSCFRTLRKIHDRCNFTFGLLFVGTERLLANLSRMQGEYAYVTNRLSYCETLSQLTKNDVKMLVNQIFENVDDASMTEFIRCSNYNARVLFNLIKRTNDILKSSNEELNPKMILTAKKMLLV